MISLGSEITGHRLDQGVRHLQLRVADSNLPVQHVELGLSHLIRPDHRLQCEHIPPRSQHGQRFLAPHRDLGQAHPAGSLQRSSQQLIRLAASRIWFEVVPAGQRERIDLVSRHEGDQLDDLGGGQRQVGEILVCQENGLS